MAATSVAKGQTMPEGLTGSLTQLPLADILTMLCAGGQSGRLELAEGSEHGEVFLRGGMVVHAITGVRSGEAAISEILRWKSGAFRFQPQVMTGSITIDKPVERLLAEGLRQASARDAVLRVIPSGQAVPRLSVEAPDGPVTLHPHEWQILARIDGRASIAELAAAMRCDEFALMEMLVPLTTSGLIRLDVPAKVVAARMTAPAAFFQSLTTAVAAAMGPLAEINIDDCLESLGATRETLARQSASTLVERIAGEIRDPEQRVRFQQTMLQVLRAQAA